MSGIVFIAVRSHFLPTISYHFLGSSEVKFSHCYRENSKCGKIGAVSSCVSEV